MMDTTRNEPVNNARLQFAAASLALCLAVCPLATPRVMSTVPTDRLIATADVIVAGEVLKTETANDVTTLTVKAERVPKGNLTPGVTFDVMWSSPVGRAAPPTSKPWRALLFLTGTSSGRLRLLPVLSGAEDVYEATFVLPNPEVAPATEYLAGDSPSDKVVRELAVAVEKGDGGPHRMMPDLVGFARRSPRSPAAKQAFERFAASASERLQREGMRGLIAIGDVRSLAELEKRPAELGDGNPGRAVLEEIRSYYRNPDSAGVQVLGRMALAETNSLDLRAASATALARIHTKAALPFLASLLDSPDPTLRTLAVGGLAMFANNISNETLQPLSGEWPFRTDATMRHSAMDVNVISAQPSYYLDFWRNWWLENRGRVMGSLK